MFEKLFVKTSDLVFHTIAPYAVERERFLAHCCEEGFSKAALRRIAGIVVTAACDLHTHGGLAVDQVRLEAAAGRIEMTRRQTGVRDDARGVPPRVSSCHDSMGPVPGAVVRQNVVSGVLRERLMALEQIDFFPTAVRAETTASRLALEDAMQEPAPPPSQQEPYLEPAHFQNRCWVRRPRPGGDRMATLGSSAIRMRLQDKTEGVDVTRETEEPSQLRTSSSAARASARRGQ